LKAFFHTKEEELTFARAIPIAREVEEAAITANETTYHQADTK